MVGALGTTPAGTGTIVSIELPQKVALMGTARIGLLRKVGYLPYTSYWTT